MFTLLALLVALHSGVLGIDVCRNMDTAGDDQNERDRKVSMTFEDTKDLHKEARSKNPKISETFRAKLAWLSELVKRRLKNALHESNTRGGNIVFPLALPSSIGVEAADDELRRVQAQAQDDFSESSDSLLFTLRDGLGIKSEGGPKRMRGMMGRLETYAELYHQNVQHPAMRSLLALNGVNTFFFVQSIITLIHDKNADIGPFSKLLSFVGLIPQGMGVLDDAIRTVEVTHWLIGKFSATSRVIKREGGLVIGKLRKIPFALERFNLWRRTHFSHMLENGLKQASTRLSTMRMSSQKLAARAMDVMHDMLEKFSLWIQNYRSSFASFGLKVLRVHLADMTQEIGLNFLRLAATLSPSAPSGTSSRWSTTYTMLLRTAGTKACTLANQLKGISALNLNSAALREILGAHVLKVAHKFKVASVGLRHETRASARGFSSATRLIKNVLPSVDKFRAFATKTILAPVKVDIASPMKLVGRVSESVAKVSSFVLRSLSSIGLEAGAVRNTLAAARNALGYARVFAFTKFKSFSSRLTGFMNKAAPFMIVFDIFCSVIALRDALKQFDAAKQNPLLMEVATANLVTASFFMANAAVSAVLTAMITVAIIGVKSGLVAAGVVSALSCAMGVVGVVGIVFMIVAYFVMQHYVQKLQCRAKLVQFHHYATTFARQVEQFMNPSGPLTTFTMMDTVYDRSRRANVSLPSYLYLERLTVDAKTYLPELRDFSPYLQENGWWFQTLYDESALKPRPGSLSTVILPQNTYFRPGEHSCKQSKGCERRRLAMRSPGAVLDSLQNSQREALDEFFGDNSGSSNTAMVLLPQNATREATSRWMGDGQHMIKHDDTCGENGWVRYSNATMPSPVTTKRRMELIVNVPSLRIITPQVSVPTGTSQYDTNLEYVIHINGNQEHQQLSSATNRICSYTLTIPYIKQFHYPYHSSHFAYVINHNTPESVNVHWTIEFPHGERAAMLRWKGDGGVHEEIRSFCVPEPTSVIEREWNINLLTKRETRRLKFQARSSSMSERMGFLVKRGHYQFSVDPKQKVYQLLAVTLVDPAQVQIDILFPPDNDIYSFESIRRTKQMLAILDVLDGYRKSHGTIHNYAPGTLAIPIYFGDKDLRPAFYFNPSQGADRQWSYFCPRWKDSAHDIIEAGYIFDCADTLLPNLEVHNVSVTHRGLNVTYYFPDLNDPGMSGFDSTISVLLPVEGVATVETVRCPRCERNGVQTALKRAMMQLKDTKGLIQSIYFSRTSLYIENVMLGITRYYSPEVYHRHEPFDAARQVPLGYFRTGDCFMLRDRFVANDTERIRLYRAVGVSDGTSDDSRLAVSEPEMPDPSTHRGPDGDKFIAAMATKDASCPVQALNDRSDVFCVTCLDVTLSQGRSVRPFEHPDFVHEFVYAKRPVEFFTDTVSMWASGRSWRVLPGVLMFKNLVFALPPPPSGHQADNGTPWYRFIGYWATFGCAAFKLADSERVSCYGAFPEDEVNRCQGLSRCVFRTAPLGAHFTLTTGQDARVHEKAYPNQLFLTSELSPSLTFACTVNPTTHALTLEYVASTTESCHHEFISPVPDVLQRMGRGVALLVVNTACAWGRYSFGGCYFDVSPVSQLSEAPSSAVVRVLSRDIPVWTRYPSWNAVTFVNIEDGRLFRVKPIPGRRQRSVRRCRTKYLNAVVARPFATLASTPAEKVAASTGDRESIFASSIELHIETRHRVRVPYIRDFATQRVTVVVPDSRSRVRLNWVEFNTVPVDQKVQVDIFIPRRVNLPSTNRLQNPNITVKFHQVDDQERDRAMHENQGSAVNLKAASLLSMEHALGERTQGVNPCLHCAEAEICVARSVCFDPVQSFTRVYPRVLDPKFLPSDPSLVAAFYCVVNRGRKYCHDRMRLYSILGKVLGRVQTVTPVNDENRDRYTVLYKKETVGTICLCRSTRCETMVMRGILQESSVHAFDFECDFVVRPLVVPDRMPGRQYGARFSNVWRAFRLFPEPDANSERGRLSHARIELSDPRGGDPKYNRPKHKIQYNAFYFSAQCRQRGTECAEHVLDGSAQRLAFAEIIDGFFVQVTSTGAVPAHEETPFPEIRTAQESVLVPFLGNLIPQSIHHRGIDIRMNDLFDVARSVLHFGLYALDKNFDLTALNEWDFHCSVLLDQMGNFRYYDPNGGVSFYAYEKLEKKQGAAKVGKLPQIVGNVLKPVTDAIYSWNIMHLPGDDRDPPRDILNALDRMLPAITAFMHMREDSTNHTALEEHILEFEMMLSSFPRLQHCEIPVNATATAERYAVNRFINEYLIFVDTINVNIVDVFSIGETYRPDSPNEMAEQFLDTSCPALHVTMDLCKRPDDPEGTTCKVVKLSLLYYHDGSSRSPRGTRVPRSPLETLVTTDEELAYKAYVKNGCQKINDDRAPGHQYGYCVKCFEGYQLDDGSCQSQPLWSQEQDSPRVGKFFTQESRTLTSSTLFNFGLPWMTFERQTFGQRTSCPSPRCDWDGCTVDAFSPSDALTCRVVREPRAYPAQAATQSTWPDMLTLRWTASEMRCVHELNAHGYVGHYVLANSSSTNPVWRKIEPAGASPQAPCSHHYLRLENQRWVFACYRAGAQRWIPSAIESGHSVSLMHLPYVSWSVLPDFTLSPRKCSANSQCSTPCCQAVVVQAVSKADYCLNAQTTPSSADVYQVYLRDNEADALLYRSTDGKNTLTRNSWNGQLQWELKSSSILVARWPLHHHEFRESAGCVERQSDHAKFFGFQVECLDTLSTSTVNGVPQCPMVRDHNCRHGRRPQLKLEDWGLSQPISACHLFCSALGEQCEGYKVVAPWCYLWLTEDDAPRGQEFLSVTPNERVPQTCDHVCTRLRKADCIESDQCIWFPGATDWTTAQCMEKRDPTPLVSLMAVSTWWSRNAYSVQGSQQDTIVNTGDVQMALQDAVCNVHAVQGLPQDTTASAVHACQDDDTGLRSADADRGSWRNWSCKEAANRAYCNHGTKNKNAMHTFCRFSCGICECTENLYAKVGNSCRCGGTTLCDASKYCYKLNANAETPTCNDNPITADVELCTQWVTAGLCRHASIERRIREICSPDTCTQNHQARRRFLRDHREETVKNENRHNETANRYI